MPTPIPRLESTTNRLGVVACVLAGLVGTMAAVFVFGMRTKSPRVQRAIRQVNKAFWNPKAMETAGTRGGSASVVHHVGRRSGTAYHTPVGPVKTDDGFVITLPYGRRADWVQNVLSAGRATLTHKGRTYEVEQPEVVPIDSTDVSFPKPEQAAQRVLKVDECLRLRRVDTSMDDATEFDADRIHTPSP